MLIIYSIVSIILLVLYVIGVATLYMTHTLKAFKIDTVIVMLLIILPIYAFLLEMLGRLMYIIGIDINLLF